MNRLFRFTCSPGHNGPAKKNNGCFSKEKKRKITVLSRPTISRIINFDWRWLYMMFGWMYGMVLYPGLNYQIK